MDKNEYIVLVPYLQSRKGRGGITDTFITCPRHRGGVASCRAPRVRHTLPHRMPLPALKACPARHPSRQRPLLPPTDIADLYLVITSSKGLLVFEPDCVKLILKLQ